MDKHGSTYDELKEGDGNESSDGDTVVEAVLADTSILFLLAARVIRDTLRYQNGDQAEVQVLGEADQILKDIVVVVGFANLWRYDVIWCLLTATMTSV